VSEPLGGIYLDWNATTPPHPRVIRAMVEAAELAWGNPASVHAHGRRARALVEGLRETLASALGFDARDVVLTSGGTEANNQALQRAPGLVTSRLEHPSVVAVAERLAAGGRSVRWLPVPESGRLDPASLHECARGLPPGSWLAVQAANHETGVLQPIVELGARAHELGLFVHVDAVQAFGKMGALDLGAADSVAVAAHKIRGPKGIGALAYRGKAPPPVLVGGSQERGLRPGTVDPVAAAGFCAAVELARSAPERWAPLARLRDRLEGTLLQWGTVNGTAARLPHVTNLSFRGVRGDELVAALDMLGIRVSSGSACSAGTTEASPVITVMVGVERARGAVRVSLGEDVTFEQVSQTESAFLQAIVLASAEARVSRDARLEELE
jgi:cysteine desulfurase